ncbi:MAG: ABC transporter ATP-binding protein [Alphaproteobacteria bacterium]|jgi:putative tryptophan/tyrosine transport system ATP-binding protein|nr:ABC transporter ATP-binding protein [Alphaproteobacteria bacterium]
MIRLQDIHVTFAPDTVMEKKGLRGLDLSINEGEFVTVIGSNGAGKSTLLNSIAGEVLPTSGSIYIDDDNMTKLSGYARAHFVARVFQDPLAGSCGDLTIAENLALAQRRGKSRRLSWALSRSLKQELKEVLKRLKLGLEDRLDTSMSLLSGGQRQAVSLLMATLSPLKILLLDEHTSALDPKTAAYVMDLTQAIITEKKLTALMVTHSLQQALRYGTRTIMLHEGKIIYDVKGEERSKLTSQDLLKQFGTSVDDDSLLLQGT